MGWISERRCKNWVPVILLSDQEMMCSLSGMKNCVFHLYIKYDTPWCHKGRLVRQLLGGIIYFVTLGTISLNYESPKGRNHEQTLHLLREANAERTNIADGL